VTVSIFASTALDYLNNRYHDPTLGRFISVDPWVDETGDAYGYAGNNPITYADPSGLILEDLSGTIDAGAAGIDAWQAKELAALELDWDVVDSMGAICQNNSSYCETGEMMRDGGGSAEAQYVQEWYQRQILNHSLVRDHDEWLPANKLERESFMRVRIANAFLFG
jgi:uncharacterized protein RhaS with RHS repeats